MAKAKAAEQEVVGLSLDDEGEGTVDFSNVEEDAGFALLPKGTYDAEVSEVEYTISKNSGNPMWALKLRLTGEEHNNRTFFFHMPFTDKMMGRHKKTLAILGAGDLLEGPFNPREVAEEGRLVGLPCRLRLEHETYEGEKRNKVKNILKASEGGGFDV